MATITPYQRQFRTRMKRALRLRASSDSKARRYAQKLADALRLSQDAAAQMNALNQLYNVDVSTQTILIHDLLDAVQPDQLVTLLGQSTPGEELQLFNPIPDGNGGQPLPLECAVWRNRDRAAAGLAAAGPGSGAAGRNRVGHCHQPVASPGRG